MVQSCRELRPEPASVRGDVVGSKKPIKVAVIGGGCASIAAAFELTRPEHGGKYDVTVYQMGWRLGGKGASGRGAAGRVEEHGLHVQRNLRPNAFRYRASIKSQRMLLHIEGSKGGADQYATIAGTPSPFDRLSLDLITQDPD